MPAVGQTCPGATFHLTADRSFPGVFCEEMLTGMPGTQMPQGVRDCPITSFATRHATGRSRCEGSAASGGRLASAGRGCSSRCPNDPGLRGLPPAPACGRRHRGSWHTRSHHFAAGRSLTSDFYHFIAPSRSRGAARRRPTSGHPGLPAPRPRRQRPRARTGLK